jgi:hypothetical protein
MFNPLEKNEEIILMVIRDLNNENEISHTMDTYVKGLEYIQQIEIVWK